MPARIAARRWPASAAGVPCLLPVMPMAACVAVAWLLAALSSVVWAVLVDLPRNRGGTTAD